jgi:hypothetical protein
MDEEPSLLVDVAMLYVSEASRTPLTQEVSDQIRTAFNHVILGGSPTDLSELLISHVDSTSPLDRITSILTVPDEPLPPIPKGAAEEHREGRRKPRPWTLTEDNRLLAGIHRFGLKDWGSIANFVGGGRHRAQCAQRWTRGLDPRIVKTPWTPEEESKLLRLMRDPVNAGWTRVSALMGNRSDTQCRYHFWQMGHYGKVPPDFVTERKARKGHPETQLRVVPWSEPLRRAAQATRMATPPARPPPAAAEPLATSKSTAIDLRPNQFVVDNCIIEFATNPIGHWF